MLRFDHISCMGAGTVEYLLDGCFSKCQWPRLRQTMKNICFLMLNMKGSKCLHFRQLYKPSVKAAISRKSHRKKSSNSWGTLRALLVGWPPRHCLGLIYPSLPRSNGICMSLNGQATPFIQGSQSSYQWWNIKHGDMVALILLQSFYQSEQDSPYLTIITIQKRNCWRAMAAKRNSSSSQSHKTIGSQ